ncbi:hypothetical protein BJ322DRAFT_1079903 [Thelephora terrestris]|uniref:Uncharacterized protein n=1 Tax=Thelephora terrestris TaxID=56493 RepID=A0A9P6L359_9AGAM|nr:hypothetical protein BJ322DRAFT_1079903 [Thelephora terrestris]
MSGLDIRMIPKRMLVAKEQTPSPILSKNPRKERSDLSLIVIIPKATVHRFAVVRVKIKRRVVGALDLIIRRGALPFPESEPTQLGRSRTPEVKDHKLDSEDPRVLLHNPTLADPQAWILPHWTYIVFPKAEVLRMPLPDLVERLRSGLKQVNRRARAWQDQYLSPETGEFIPLLSKAKGLSLPSEPRSWGSEPKSRYQNGKPSTPRQSWKPSRFSPDT